MIRLPSGPATTGAAAATGGTNTPTTNTAPSPVTPGSQSMQTVTSATQPSNVGPPLYPGSNGPTVNPVGSVTVSSQGPQQQAGNSVLGNNKNGLNRPVPSPSQGQTPSNAVQQASTGDNTMDLANQNIQHYPSLITHKLIKIYFLSSLAISGDNSRWTPTSSNAESTYAN